MKKGQITLFIIVGILFLFLLGFVIMFSTMTKEEPLSLAKQQHPEVTDYIENCIMETGEDAVTVLGFTGGYYYPPLHTISTVYGEIPLYYREPRVIEIPNPGEMRDQFNYYMNNELEYCLSEISSLTELGINVNFTAKPITNTLFTTNGILFKVTLPIQLYDSKGSAELDQFEYEINTRFLKLYYIAVAITGNISSEPQYIPSSLLLNLSEENYVQIDTYTGNNTYIYVIQDKLLENPTSFVFAVNYDVSNRPPVLSAPVSLKMLVNESFYFAFTAIDPDDDLLYFISSDSERFPVGYYTGDINYTPTEKASYWVNVTVSDGLANSSAIVLVDVI